jgi:sec-independent protein translocase protein TatA
MIGHIHDPLGVSLVSARTDSKNKEHTMMGLGWGELLIILLIVIAVFGTSRIAGIGNALGGSIREFKKAVRDDEPKTDVPTIEKTESKI